MTTIKLPPDEKVALERQLTDAVIAYCKAPPCDSSDFFAAHFAAKKAHATSVNVPTFIFQGYQQGQVNDKNPHDRALLEKLGRLFPWAAALGTSKLQVIEIRDAFTPSLLEPLLSPEVYMHVRIVSSAEAAAQCISGCRVLVAGGNLSQLMYTMHELLKVGRASEVGLVPHLCSSPDSAGALPRAAVVSHMEEVHRAKICYSVGKGIEWLLPDGPLFPKVALGSGTLSIQLSVLSKDDTQLTHAQEELVRLVLDTNVISATLKKLGKGWSPTLKFFCTPTVEVEGVTAEGAMTFIKMGPEDGVAEELEITRTMMQLLGNFCPQVLGYADVEDEACMVTSIANLGTGPPRGLADLWANMLSAAGTQESNVLVTHIEAAIGFVFGNLLQPLYTGGASAAEPFSVADELGLSFDVSGVDPKDLPQHRFSSWWVLRNSWTRWGGDGKLQSSLQSKAAALVGEAEAAAETITLGNVTLPNVLQRLLKNVALLQKLRDIKLAYPVCMVHGDLHGDNVMVDPKDNAFVIDFGKTGLGNALEDFTWLETYLLMAYPEYDEEDFVQMMSLVQTLADDLLPATLAPSSTSTPTPAAPRVAAIWGVMRGMRLTLSSQIARMRTGADDDTFNLVAALLLLRNALMQFVFPHNDKAPLRGKLGLALACGYAASIEKIVAAQTC